MSNVYTVQAVFIATSGRMYKAKPVDLRDGLELDDYKQGLRSGLRMGSYPIDFVNEMGHEQVIMPVNVETIIFNILAVRPEHSFLEPEYERLREQWQSDLRGRSADGQEVIADHKLAQEVAPVQPVAPVAPGSAASTVPIPSTISTPVYKYAGSKLRDPKVYDMANEETQEMPISKPTENDEKTMATKAVDRAVAGAAGKTGPERPVERPRATHSGQRASSSGKLPRS